MHAQQQTTPAVPSTRLHIAAILAAGMVSDWNKRGHGLHSTDIRKDLIYVSLKLADELIEQAQTNVVEDDELVGELPE